MGWASFHFAPEYAIPQKDPSTWRDRPSWPMLEMVEKDRAKNRQSFGRRCALVSSNSTKS
jgi:hypothetical protein